MVTTAHDLEASVTRSLRPRTLAAAVAAGVLVLGLAACAPETPHPTGTTSDSSSASPSGSASDTPSPSPTAEAGITPQSISGLTIGASFVAAGKSLGVKPEAQCPWVLRTDDDGWEMWVVADNSANPTDAISIVSIDTFGAGAASNPHPPTTPRTAAGIGLGSTLAELRAAYPSLTNDTGSPAMDFALRYTDGAGSIVFGGRDDVVGMITVLAAGQANAPEYCA